MKHSVARQLGLSLPPLEPSALSYFIPHSGVIQAVAALESALDGALNASRFQVVYLYGPLGTGKSHLLQGFATRALQSGLGAERLEVIDLEASNLGTAPDSWRREFADGQAQFISRFEQLKSRSGLLLIASPCAIEQLTENPHLVSRLKYGSVCGTAYPQDTELVPIIRSLAERENLRLADNAISYLLKRLPGKPLSFADILARIGSLSLAQNRPAGLGVIREAVLETEKSN